MARPTGWAFGEQYSIQLSDGRFAACNCIDSHSTCQWFVDADWTRKPGDRLHTSSIFVW